MNATNIRLLASVVDASNRECKLGITGPDSFVGLVTETIKHFESTDGDGVLPSPANWLGLGYEQAEQLFDMKPYCPHCTEAMSEAAEAGKRAVFNAHPAPLRRAILRDLLNYLAGYGAVDWHTAKHMNDVEVAA